MATCGDRQLTQPELEAGYQQQRTGVVQALRPFSSAPTLDNLIDYVNRELGPAVRNARAKVNDCWQQVTDNAPSANPLGYYFSTNVANADPTAGRVRLNASPENAATTLRVSESNARLQDVSPWLDMMIGGSTSPLGVVTLLDAVNPGRYLRGNLTNITPQTGYRDLSITVFEASHPDPFVDGEAVLISYIAGMADGGVVVPVSVLAPMARDTFIANIGTSTASPAETPLANVDSTSIVYDGTSHTFQRAALTGFATAGADSNTTASAEPLVSYSSSSNMSAERVTTSSTSVTVDLGTASQVLFKRAALTGDVTASADSNATTIAAHAVTNAKAAQMAADTFKGNNTNATADAADVGLSAIGSTSLPYDAASHTFRRAALTGEVTASINSNATTVTRSTDFASTPWTGAHQFNGATLTTLSSCATTLNGTLDVVNVASLDRNVCFGGFASPTALAADQDNYNPTSWGDASVIRLSTSGGTDRVITGAAAGLSGELKWLINLGPNLVTLKHENASSTADNRFLMSSGTNHDISVNGASGILYDSVSSRWRLVTNA